METPKFVFDGPGNHPLQVKEGKSKRERESDNNTFVLLPCRACAITQRVVGHVHTLAASVKDTVGAVGAPTRAARTAQSTPPTSAKLTVEAAGALTMAV